MSEPVHDDGALDAAAGSGVIVAEQRRRRVPAGLGMLVAAAAAAAGVGFLVLSFWTSPASAPAYCPRPKNAIPPLDCADAMEKAGEQLFAWPSNLYLVLGSVLLMGAVMFAVTRVRAKTKD